MRSLFLKIFLWFWLATILSGLTLFVIGVATQSGPIAEQRRRLAEQARHLMGQTLALYGQTAAAILERDGHAALEDYAKLIERTTDIHVILLLRRNEILSDRGPPRKRGPWPRAQRNAARPRLLPPGKASCSHNPSSDQEKPSTWSWVRCRARQVGRGARCSHWMGVANRLPPPRGCQAASSANSRVLPVVSAFRRSLLSSLAEWCVSGWLGI